VLSVTFTGELTAYPVRWTWLHWWETNRDSYLQALRQGEGQKPNLEAFARYRRQATDALLAALKATDWRVRMSAAIALGQMGDPSSLDRLAALADGDSDENVRCGAILAVGLLDCPKGETFLASHRFGTSQQGDSAVVALGLMTQCSPETISNLQKLVGSPDTRRGAIAAWALSRRSDPRSLRYVQSLLERTTDSLQASEAILAIGRQGAPASDSPLASILLATPAGRSVPAYRALQQRRDALRLEYLRAKADANYRSNARGLFQAAVPGGGSQDPGVPLGTEDIYLARLRASAAIALATIDTPVSRQALLKCLQDPEDGYSQLYKAQAIMSLGILGEPGVAPVLTGLLARTNNTGGMKSEEEIRSPLRGHAALALGLYCRPVPTPQGPADRPKYHELSMVLAERLADSREELEVRSACAAALGLTGRTENLPYLRSASANLTARDYVLAGYAILARGMLSDRAVLDAAAKYLVSEENKEETDRILGRRATVLGLGLAGTQEAIPILTRAWDSSSHVNREVMLALCLCQAYNVTEPLVKMLADSSSAERQAFAARCLGEIFLTTRPSRLARMVQGGNYMVRNPGMYPYQVLANEFLCRHLLESFGKAWR